MAIDPNIYFPAGIDSFPTLRDYSTSLNSELYTLDQSHYNKLVNFIRKVQPLLGVQNTASGDGSIKAVGYSYVFQVWFPNLVLNSCAIPAQAGKMGFTNVLPFQFVLTDKPFNLQNVPSPQGFSGNNSNLLGVFQVNSGTLENLIGPQNSPQASPLVTITTKSAIGQINSSNFRENRFLVSCTASCASGVILINGLIINTALPNPSTFHSPSSPYPELYSIWPGCEDLYLVCTITGVR